MLGLPPFYYFNLHQANLQLWNLKKFSSYFLINSIDHTKSKNVFRKNVRKQKEGEELK